MKKFVAWLSAVALALAGASAQAQTRVFVRGTITSLDGNVLSVKSRDGKDLKINLAPKFGACKGCAFCRDRRRSRLQPLQGGQAR